MLVLPTLINLFLFIYFTFAKKNKYYKKEMKNIYILLLRLHNLQGRKSYKKNNSKLNVVLSDLTFVIDRVVRKPNRS